MSRHALSILAAVLILACVSSAQASDFGGSYVSNVPGGTITLTLEQDEGGDVEGSMNDGVMTIALSGMREDDAVRGDASLPDGGRLGFVASFGADGALQIKLFPYDAAGNAFQDLAQTMTFVRAGGASSTPTPAPAPEGTVTRSVYINGVQLKTELVLAAEAQYQTRIEDGRYWYDAVCGAWGVEGGPTAGFLVAGLDLPGPMPANISGGGTGVFINGREIHVLDQQALEKIFGYTIPGRYWLDAQGNLGPEGGAAIANLAAAMQAARQSVTHGYDSTYGARGTVAGGMYSGRTATGKSVFWYPGM